MKAHELSSVSQLLPGCPSIVTTFDPGENLRWAEIHPVALWIHDDKYALQNHQLPEA
jgi:hypothetical protein